ncbi:glycosyltransferase family 2 protein [Pseudodesulfovibrio portus]|uniref:Glycosyltransferase 2-like domain-containing protein n=1 Tax=Pseudodesulfovibrio portus TaxID=231439 RepID=A0ABM8AS94_9BACT|nr:glycosyltransferase family 2 protein [Pseudodesulfovibrio portus]BDQ34346.1 hypothetical protein JCM14722_18880 [Pseudodesulfovibrio portus]
MADASVHAIVLNYNGQRHNSRCLRSLLDQDYPNLRVLFVDNGSDDGSVEAVRQEFGDRVDYLLNHQNLFYAAGNNRGLARALDQEAEFLFIVNNDTVLEQGCVARLARFMADRPEAGGCQPLLRAMDEGETVYSAGVLVSLSGRCWDAGRGGLVDAFGQEPSEVAGITGAAMFLRASAVREVGTFDERYVMYFEDVDYSFRLRRAGYPLYLVPGARVAHEGGATASATMPLGRIRLCETNSYRLVLDHFPDGLRGRGLLASTAFTLGSCLRNLARGNPSAAGAVLAGGRRGLRLVIEGTADTGDESRETLRSHIRVRTWFPPGA